MVLEKPEISSSDSLDGYERIRAYVVSDVHLNNHTFDRDREHENPRRRNFRQFLTRIEEEWLPTEKLLLILNGDILDITGSWFESVMPWDHDSEQVQAILNRLLQEIMENNLATFQALGQLMQHPNVELIYVFGNHDGLLQAFPQSHQVIRAFLSSQPEAWTRMRFVSSFQCVPLGLYVEHGHLLDPFNHPWGGQPALGDVINILIVNRFVEVAVNRLKANGYSADFIAKMHNRLHDIEYLRPLALVPVWIQRMASLHDAHPENVGKPQSVREILLETVSEILQDQQMTRFFTKRLHCPKPLLSLLVFTVLRMPTVLPVISFFTTKLVRRTHSNQYQYRAALKLYREQGFRLIAFGHTHIPGVMPLGENAYYFNTGSWKSVINLFKSPKNAVDLEELMSSEEAQFNKVECAGVLALEKKNGTPAEFSLQTVQHGASE